MILSALQVILLMLTAWRLQSFDKSRYRYRPWISFVAACWAGGSAALALSTILHWPEQVSFSCFVGTVAAGASCAAAFHCKGNVAQLLRDIQFFMRSHL